MLEANSSSNKQRVPGPCGCPDFGLLGTKTRGRHAGRPPVPSGGRPLVKRLGAPSNSAPPDATEPSKHRNNVDFLCT